MYIYDYIFKIEVSCHTITCNYENIENWKYSLFNNYYSFYQKINTVWKNKNKYVYILWSWNYDFYQFR